MALDVKDLNEMRTNMIFFFTYLTPRGRNRDQMKMAQMINKTSVTSVAILMCHRESIIDSIEVLFNILSKDGKYVYKDNPLVKEIFENIVELIIIQLKYSQE